MFNRVLGFVANFLLNFEWKRYRMCLLMIIYSDNCLIVLEMPLCYLKVSTMHYSCGVLRYDFYGCSIDSQSFQLLSFVLKKIVNHRTIANRKFCRQICKCTSFCFGASCCIFTHFFSSRNRFFQVVGFCCCCFPILFFAATSERFELKLFPVKRRPISVTRKRIYFITDLINNMTNLIDVTQL